MLTRSLPTAMLFLFLAPLATAAAEREALPAARGGAWTAQGLSGGILAGSFGQTRSTPRKAHPSLTALGLPAGSTDGACARCHDRARDVSHPVGVVPSMAMPSGFPLDAAGRTTCLTCHDVPATPDAAATSASDPFLLRGPGAGRAFCSACHAKFLGEGSNQHALVTHAAHGGSRSAAADVMSAGLDEESLDCMGCHDGTIGAEATSELRSSGVAFAGAPGLGKSHPVGVGYQEAALRGATLSPTGPRHASVRLFGGTVGCGSCHSVYSKRRSLLVMENARDALCVQCHAK